MLRAAVLLTCVVPSLAIGQTTPLPIDSLARGAEIRVWSREPALNGWKLQYLGRTDTSAVVAERRGSTPVARFRNEMPFRVIDRIDVSAGREHESANRFLMKALKGGGIGFLTGAALGGAIMLSDRQNESGVYALVVLPQAGAVIGGAIGAARGLFGPTRWRPVDFRGDQARR